MLSTKYRKLILRFVQRERDNKVKIEKLEQACEVFGDDNRLFAAIELGRPVTEKQAWDHYLKNGGAIGYRQRRRMLHRRSA